MVCTVCIPDPIVSIKGITVVIVDFSVGSTVVSAIFRNTNGPFESAVERGVEYCFLVERATLYFDLAEGFVPDLATRFL